MLNLKNEEINGLKQHIQKFNTENISLKRLVLALEAEAKEDADLKA